MWNPARRGGVPPYGRSSVEGRLASTNPPKMPKIKFRRFHMLTRILAAVAFATLSAAAAQAGQIQGDAWTPSSACKDAGEPPAISDKNPEAYNKSGKALQSWQAAAQAYATCVQAEAKADQTA